MFLTDGIAETGLEAAPSAGANPLVADSSEHAEVQASVVHLHSSAERFGSGAMLRAQNNPLEAESDLADSPGHFGVALLPPATAGTVRLDLPGAALAGLIGLNLR